mmetsp:Transcript_35696/g.83960  ORF Transcript_35696/g.83960 Transcript_35696/m.83960 type:complete len:364 (-) Transcript_35696:156-1247(-)
MFSWKKEKDAEEEAVAVVQKKMKQSKIPKLPHKMRMRSDVVAVLKAHPSLQVKLEGSECVPPLVREKVEDWQGVQVMKLAGNVRVDSSSEYSIPLDVLVHPKFPAVQPICFVTGDLYIPKWTPESILTNVIRDIIHEFATSSVSSRQQRSALRQQQQQQQQQQVLGLILTHDAEIDWEVFESAASAAAHQRDSDAQTRGSSQSSTRAAAAAPTHRRADAGGGGQLRSHSDDDIDWEMFEAVRAVEEAEQREKRATAHAAQQLRSSGGGGGPRHDPLFRSNDETPSSFVCPISLEVMTDPVTAADGHTYEREEVEDWFRKHSTSPLTNMELPHKRLVPNTELQQQIHTYFRRADPTYQDRFMHF